MPFSPLPKTFLEDLHRRRLGRVVEVGCGDGNLSRLLQTAGVRPWRLDRRHPAVGSVADIVADACRLPLTTGGVDFLVAGNLLRHLWPVADAAPVPVDWQRCLAPGGCLYILEDEPAEQPEAARNYRHLQDFLARLLPEVRRPLLSQATFLDMLQSQEAGSGNWLLGLETNLWPADPQAAVSLLRGKGAEHLSATGAIGQQAGPAKLTGAVQRLVDAIEQHGLSYGQYWWARWSPEVQD